MTTDRRERDRGALTLSFALVFPMMLLLVMLVAQVALLWYSQSVALAAAREGADAGRVLGGTDQAATDRAQAFLDGFRGLLGSPTVDRPVRTQATITVTVHIHPLFLLPGFDGLTISQRAQAPIERFVGP
ncbi:TadE/TadG family type IV pilus assembly protein [Kitasatospora kifunensis]|uniref:Flp pilus assembly protein TadG n=1 Tax=Kitasatospora kifunensis TaxID=58351 RepID=A0A7W7VYJ0_KITKI|nr:TadE/TadG family type IV pilus assembly protein [Kitasatospora kifunensis]MBB4926700.1 Flp pilus assembly protein TadG [Kitasatospora kifunensis]